MHRRNFILAAIAASTPIKVQPRSQAKVNCFCFRVPRFYVSAVRDPDEVEWTLYVNYFKRATDSVQTAFPKRMQDKFAACGIRGKVISSNPKGMRMRTDMNPEEVMRICEGLVV